MYHRNYLNDCIVVFCLNYTDVCNAVVFYSWSHTNTVWRLTYLKFIWFQNVLLFLEWGIYFADNEIVFKTYLLWIYIPTTKKKVKRTISRACTKIGKILQKSSIFYLPLCYNNVKSVNRIKTKHMWKIKNLLRANYFFKI